MGNDIAPLAIRIGSTMTDACSRVLHHHR
jgi:hypothetical protein